jgi:hypothetical protein
VFHHQAANNVKIARCDIPAANTIRLSHKNAHLICGVHNDILELMSSVKSSDPVIWYEFLSENGMASQVPLCRPTPNLRKMQCLIHKGWVLCLGAQSMKNPDRTKVLRLEDLPYICKAMAADLRLIGIERPQHLIG